MQVRSAKHPSAVAQSERELVARCRAGDRDALSQVFEANAEQLGKLIARVVGPNADVEDVLQNTFIAAIRSFPRFRGEASVYTWLRRIAVAQAMTSLRRPAARKRVQLQLVSESADPPEVDAEEELTRRQQLERVYEHLSTIKAKKRTAFILHVFEGHSMEEVAALMNATRAATKSRVFWARRELLAKAQRDPLLRSIAEDIGGPP